MSRIKGDPILLTHPPLHGSPLPHLKSHGRFLKAPITAALPGPMSRLPGPHGRPRRVQGLGPTISSPNQICTIHYRLLLFHPLRRERVGSKGGLAPGRVA